ncbi:MAG: hypothetical protein ACTSP4_13645 [Candidatus Hodarchaeales archaeon]
MIYYKDYTYSHGEGRGDAWLVRTDSECRMLWNQTYGGNEADEAHGLIQASDGGFVLSGLTRSYGVGYSDFWLVRAVSECKMPWNQSYGGEYERMRCNIAQLPVTFFSCLSSTVLKIIPPVREEKEIGTRWK